MCKTASTLLTSSPAIDRESKISHFQFLVKITPKVTDVPVPTMIIELEVYKHLLQILIFAGF